MLEGPESTQSPYHLVQPENASINAFPKFKSNFADLWFGLEFAKSSKIVKKRAGSVARKLSLPQIIVFFLFHMTLYKFLVGYFKDLEIASPLYIPFKKLKFKVDFRTF